MKNKQLHLQKIYKTLNFITQKLNLLNIKWFLGASGALMIHGIDIVPWDLDIFTTAKNVKLLEKEFKEYIVNPLHCFDQVNQKEIEFQMKINDIEVEVCELNNFSGLQMIKFQGIPIPVNSLQTELGFYQKRQGKEKIVKLIKEKLSQFIEFLPILAEFYISDFAKSLNFYIDIIGFKMEYQRENPNFAFLSFNGSQIMIQELKPGEKEAEKLEYPFGRGINFQIDTKSVQKIIDSLKKNKYPLKRGIKDNWYRVGNKAFGCREILVLDPDGYLLRFSEELGEKVVEQKG